jgi:glutathione S-transferase
MNDLKLVIGSRWASSWSLRPWLILKQLGLAFEEIVIPLRQPDTARHIRRYSPSGKVPVLLAGPLRIWDSLAIAEYLAEQYPSLWPTDRPARALARSACCEMHSGFAALRTFLPMDFTARFEPPGKLLGAVESDIDRILAIWAECRRAAGPGPFLFGAFTVTDAMFAPVCSRFTTYAVPLPAQARDYVAYIMELPALLEWGRLAEAELTSGERMPATQPSEPAPPPPAGKPVAVAATAPPLRPPPLPQAVVQAPQPTPEPVHAAKPMPELALPPVQPEPPPIAAAPPPPPPVQGVPSEPPAELRRVARPIPSTIMVKPIGDGTRRRR